MVILLLYELDIAYVKAIGGIPNNEATERSSSGNGSTVDHFYYCDEPSLTLNVSETFRNAMKIYFILTSIMAMLVDLLATFQHVRHYNTAKLIMIHLNGKKKKSLLSEATQFRIALFFFASLVLTEIFLMEQATERGAITIAIDGLRIWI